MPYSVVMQANQPREVQMIKFNKHHIADKSTGLKVSVWYALDNRIDGRKVVTVYAKGYDNKLSQMIQEGYENETDMRMDYFEKGRVRIFENHPLYTVARQAVESFHAA